MMQVMMYAVPVYLADGDMTPDIEQLMRWASLILTTAGGAVFAAPFFVSAWRDLKLRRVGMDVPVALGVGAAFAASLWATLIAAGEVYFDSVTMFVFFLLSGRYLEMMARQKAARSVETLARAIPAFAMRLAAWPDTAGERVAVVRVASCRGCGAGQARRNGAGRWLRARGRERRGRIPADRREPPGAQAGR
jgi:Cu2+-exporting ATPase